MQDRELYGRILGIQSPWQVERVELKLESGAVHVYLEHAPETNWLCPECSAPSPLYDHQPERRWRHLDTCQYQTILHASPPRTACKEHGVKVVALPWAQAGSRFTALFEALAIAWLKAASQKAVAQQLHLSWDEIHGIMERAVERGLKRRQAEPIAHLGVDEKAFRLRPEIAVGIDCLKEGSIRPSVPSDVAYEVGAGRQRTVRSPRTMYPHSQEWHQTREAMMHLPA